MRWEIDPFWLWKLGLDSQEAEMLASELTGQKTNLEALAPEEDGELLSA